MKLSAKYLLMRWPALMLSVLLACEPVAFAQYEAPIPPPPDNAPAQARPAFSQPELDQMLAPIALYPDPLLSQILMAATYPLEVVEAARWSRANPSLRGEDAVRAVQQSDWDPSVISLMAFPQILQMMDEKLTWTERLGDAFLAQEQQVMGTVQNLRQKAYVAGNLRTNEQVRVEQEGQIIIVEPASPEIIYVPYYDSNVVYGSWWWSDYPPVYWAPWPDYYYNSGFAWGVGIVITTGFFFGDCDWHHHHVNVVNVNNFYYHRAEHDKRHAPGIWHHEPEHRRGIPYLDASLRQRYGRESASPEARHEFRREERPAFSKRGESGNRQTEGGSAIVLPARPADRRLEHGGIHEKRNAEIRPGTERRQEPRTDERGGQVRPSVPREASRPAGETRPHASEDKSHGTNVRNNAVHERELHERSESAGRGQTGTPAQRAPDNAAGDGRMQHPR